MTPIVVVLFILALCTSYVYIAMNATTFTYVGDYKYVLFKLMITLSIIAMGYLSTWFTSAYEFLPVVGPRIAQGLQSLTETSGSNDQSTHTIARTFMEYLSGVWFVFAIALLPFGHTVYTATSQEIDVDRTNQLQMMHQAIYSGPYYLMTLIFSINLFVVFVALGNCNNPMFETQVDLKDFMTKFGSNVKTIVPTCGWFFYTDHNIQ